jgi:PAS domain S-box-containing protein
MLLSNLKIRGKLLLTLVTVAVITLGATAIGEFQVTRAALERSSFDRLTAVREMKAQQIEEYFETISDLVLSFAETESTRNALANFALAFRIIEGQATRRDNDPGARDTVAAENDNLMSYYAEEFYPRLARNLVDPVTAGPDQFYPSGVASRYLQNLYISANPQPVDEKHLLASVGDGSVYDNLHARYHSSFSSYLDRFGFYDIFLVEPQDGIIVYSVFKEVDFATSLLTGPYSGSGLADVVRQALASDEPGELFVSDFSSYAPSYNAPAAFIATPVFMGGDMIGVVALQMPIDRINQIMTSQNSWSDVGLGQTGETYIVGSDFRMRNQSRFLIDDPDGYFEAIRLAGVTEATVQAIQNFDSTVGLQEVRTPGTVAALIGVTSTEIFPDYRGVNVLSSYRPLALDGLDWVIMSEIDEAEAFAPIETLKRTTLLIGSGIFAFIAMMSFFIARAVARPIKELTERAEALATGDLSTRIEAVGRDEVHLLAKSFESMRLSLRDLIEGLEQKVAERTKDLSDSETRTRAILNNAADAVIVIDAKGVVQDFNPSAEATFGYPASDIIGGKVEVLMPKRHSQNHDAYLQRYHDTGEKHVLDQSREVEGLRKDGTEFPLELHVGEVVLEEEKLFVGIIRDITERKKQEKEIADNLSFVTTLVDSVPNPIFVKDTSGRYVNFNRAYEQTFDIRREDIIGKSALELEFFTEDYRNTRHEEDLNLLRDGGSTHRQMRVVLSDGKEHDMLFWARAFDLSDGSRGGVLGVFVDISEQKELERQLAIANKRMGDELNIGRQIQMSMIPLTFPRFPEHKDLDVWAYIRPAREVGGDFYDFFMIDDRYFAFVIADVSGKGVPAALMMAVAKTMLKSRAQDTKSTANIISATNNELSENNEECMFITAFFGIVDTKTGILTYTNAGHNPPYLLKTDGTMQVLGEMHGPMVGVMPGVPYGEAQTKLDVDDKIVLYTDGITEAFDARGIDYGEKRLEECLQRSHQLGTKYLVEAMVRDVDDFVADAEQSDDITLFCLRYVAWDVRDARGTVELRLANKLPEIDRCLQALAEICQRFELPPNIQQDFSVVLDDLLNNVISYAFSDAKEHIIDVVLSTDGQRFIVSVADDGVEFDPFTRKDPDILSGIEDREIGGLGIHLIRNLMDDYSYRRLDGRNVTTLMKRFATNTSGNSDETTKH